MAGPIINPGSVKAFVTEIVPMLCGIFSTDYSGGIFREKLFQ